ncbi:MFS transporter asaE [Fusarium oxysporum f. sp. rapae]|uniref:MFS transporter asaE n=1 Tax=Fusarium oxysporum f. sp. rapae TaxID=485398 RepID=A0A8J5NFK5_FUSOX|nr:MFS transporter asaE [Fusarium oxysporum f. sp. rapae]
MSTNSDDLVTPSLASQATGMALQQAEDAMTNKTEDVEPSTEENAGREPDLEAAPPLVSQQPEPPNGGVAWFVVLGTWCASFCSFGWINSVGAFQEYYENELLPNYSSSTISWIPSLQIFFMMAMGPIVGKIYDCYGPRYLLFGGSLLHVFGLMMASLATKYYQILLSQGVCSAIGVAAIFQAALNVIHGWFTTKTGSAFGIMATGSSLGGIVFPIMVTRLIKDVGYSWTMRICAFLILGLLIIANLTVRTFRKPQPVKLSHNQVKQLFKEPGFVLCLLGFFCFTFGIYVPITYLPVQALDIGIDASITEYLIPILNAGSLFGRILSGFAGDRIGCYNTFTIVCYLTAIWILALWIPCSTTGGIIAFASLFGLCSGAYVSLISPLVAQISPMSEIGFRTGVIYCVSSIGGLTTSPISGIIIDGAGGWTGDKVFAGVLCLAGTTFVLATRLYNTGFKLAVVF